MENEVKVTPKMKGKAFIEGFKEFILKGNIVDMAIGVIIGGAFGKIVSSLVNDIVLPPIGVLLGGVDFKDLKWLIDSNIDANGDVIEVFIRYGNFIQVILEFLIIAFVIYFTLFFFIRRKKFEEDLLAAELKKLEPEKEEKVVTPPDIILLTEIRDLLKKGEK